jgi:serine/threonine protein kinase
MAAVQTRRARVRARRASRSSPLARDAPAAEPTRPVHTTTSIILGDVIGHGGFSTVYFARLAKSLASCAIKRPALEPADMQLSGRVLIENENAVLRHVGTHACLLHYIGSVRFPDGVPGAVLEYCPLPTVEAYMNRHKRGLSEVAAITVLRHLLRAVVYLSERGVFHCDIKPANMLYDPDTCLVKLIDFGLARHDRRVTDGSAQPQEVLGDAYVGTPIYMAPERFAAYGLLGAQVYAFVAETWSIAVTAVALLRGTTLFHDTKSMAKLSLEHAHVNETADGLRMHGVSARAHTFVRGLLTYSSQRRMLPSEALTYLNALFGADDGPTSAPTSARARAPVSIRRRLSWPLIGSENLSHILLPPRRRPHRSHATNTDS